MKQKNTIKKETKIQQNGCKMKMRKSLRKWSGMKNMGNMREKTRQ